MFRSLPKLVVLAAIAALVIWFFVVNRQSATPPEPGVVYINPGFNAPSPAPPAP